MALEPGRARNRLDDALDREPGIGKTVDQRWGGPGSPERVSSGLRHGSGSCREVVEAAEIVAAEARNRALLVERGARVHVGSLSGEDVPDRDEEAVSDRDRGALRSSPARDPFVEPAQVGA